MRRTFLIGVFVALAAAAAGAAEYKHQKYFDHYEGTKTCLTCHTKQAQSFFHSQHYQWKGDAPALVNSGGKKLGKINTINDFCTGPTANWIGLVRNSRGEVITKGCSKCHAGLGKMPSEVESREQIENIDCLICHAAGYQRDLYPNDKGDWEWRPILWQNQEGLDSVSKRIGMPTRTTCLRCHSASGGGPNFKRGDLEYALADTTKEFDVHMGTDGANLQCVDCHAGTDHRVRGRGTDLAATDSPKPMSCDTGECHTAHPHKADVLNYHTERVFCTTCHVPTFARTDATDVQRDWSKPKYNAEADKWSATITLAKDIVPVYAWFDGTTWAQLPGEPVRLLPDGAIGVMVPQGNKDDAKARIVPFKLHKGRMPVLDGKSFLVPIVVEEFFADGNLDVAVKKAAMEMYGVKDAKVTWYDTTRFMGIFHEVRPAKRALACLDCHGPNGRLDWKSLGYGGDPLTSRLKVAHAATK